MQATQMHNIPYSKLKEGARIRATVSKATVQQYDLVSRVWEGTITEVSYWTTEHANHNLVMRNKIGTHKAVKIDAIPSLQESQHCQRCGIFLELESSRTFGYDISCGNVFALPNWGNIKDDNIEDFRSALAEPFRRQLWVQLDQSTIEILQEAPRKIDHHPDFDVKFIIEDNEIVVITTPDFRMLVRGVGGYRWDSVNNVWRFPPSPSIARKLKIAFDGYRRRGSPEFIALVNKADAQERAQNLKERQDLRPVKWIKGGGWAHQRSGFYFLRAILTGQHHDDDTQTTDDGDES